MNAEGEEEGEWPQATGYFFISPPTRPELRTEAREARGGGRGAGTATAGFARSLGRSPVAQVVCCFRR